MTNPPSNYSKHSRQKSRKEDMFLRENKETHVTQGKHWVSIISKSLQTVYVGLIESFQRKSKIF